MKKSKIVVKRTERGWAGHFIVCEQCIYHRNTLLETDTQKIVVSTVGNLLNRETRKFESLHGGPDVMFETVAGCAKLDGIYWEIDWDKYIHVAADNTLGTNDDDRKADAMHEAVVDELTKRLEAGEILDKEREED